MKPNRRSKLSAKTIRIARAFGVKTSAGKELELDDFAQFDLSALQSLLLGRGENPRLYEVFSGLELIPVARDDPRPEWVMRAWKECWRSFHVEPDPKDPVCDSEEVGYMIGLFSSLPFDPSRAPAVITALFELFAEMSPRIREQAANQPPAEAADFFAGQKVGSERAGSVLQLSQRTKILFVIAFFWRQAAELKSAGQLFRWLSAIEHNGRRLIAPSTDSREIRAICKSIGLRYDNRGGRPKRKTRI